MLDSIIHYDQQLLLCLNGLHCELMDCVMWYVTKTATWIPLEIVWLWLLWKQLHDWRVMLAAVIGVALVVLCADQFSSGFCKNYFCRPRPTHEPALEGLVHIVRDYRGGAYGFISSHAANTFGVATYLALIFRRRAMTVMLVAWALLCSYSRIYLGVHYPGDIVCGAVAGIVFAYIVFHLFENVRERLIQRETLLSSLSTK